MDAQQRFDEMFAELAQAIYAGDFAQAEQTLDLMRFAAPTWRGEQIQRARTLARPLPPAPSLSQPIPLPAPGADARRYFGGPVGSRGAHPP